VKKASLLVITVFVLAGSAFGAMGDLVSSFTIFEGLYCMGLARSNNYLYVADSYSYGGYIYRANPETGSIYNSYAPLPYGGSGLAYDGGGCLYVTGYDVYPKRVLYKLAEDSGSIIASYAKAIPTYQTDGLAPRWNGHSGARADALFLTDWYADRAYVMPLGIGFGSSFALPAETFFVDVAYDWPNGLLWGAKSYTTYKLFHGVNTSGSIVYSFFCDTGNTATIGGMTYYGGYLYAGSRNGVVYKIHCPAMGESMDNAGVTPASLGRVKAVFR